MEKSRTIPYHPMGNGMVERFNQTLLNMLGTLKEHQKEYWKSYVAPLVHSYNATRHDSTGYSPFFLMFGRHPRLAVDAYLELQSPEQSEVRSKEHYATKLKKRLQFAYKVASNEARKNTDRHKRNYDLKVREATLDVGDRVLVRQVGFRGRHKIADRWEKTPYVVIQIPNKDVPVFKVQKESGDQVIKTLHRNMLLPFSAIPGKWEVPDTPARPQRTRNVARRVHDECVSEHDSDSDNSESDTISEIQIPYPPAVQRKRKRSRRQNGGVPSPILDEVSRSYSTDSFNEPSVTIPGSPVNPLVDDIEQSVTLPGTQVNPSVDDIGQPSISLTESNVSHPLDYPVVPTQEQEPIRRSSRVRKAPNRYGEWISGQLVIDADNNQEYFV